MDLPKDTWVIGNKMYAVCNDCDSIVCLNKFLFGSIHICVTDEEIATKRSDEGPRHE